MDETDGAESLERVRIPEGQLVAAIAHDQALTIEAEAPALPRVRGCALRLEGGGVPGPRQPVLPGELDEPAIHQSDALRELVFRERHRTEHASRHGVDLAKGRIGPEGRWTRRGDRPRRAEGPGSRPLRHAAAGRRPPRQGRLARERGRQSPGRSRRPHWRMETGWGVPRPENPAPGAGRTSRRQSPRSGCADPSAQCAASRRQAGRIELPRQPQQETEARRPLACLSGTGASPRLRRRAAPGHPYLRCRTVTRSYRDHPIRPRRPVTSPADCPARPTLPGATARPARGCAPDARNRLECHRSLGDTGGQRERQADGPADRSPKWPSMPVPKPVDSPVRLS